MLQLETPWSLENQRPVFRLLTLYCQLLDTGQTERIGDAIFAADAVADYQGFLVEGRREIGDYVVRNMARYRATAHNLSNVWISACDQERAEVTSNITAWHWHSDAQKDLDFVLVVVNTDRLERRAEGWRVARRQTRLVGSTVKLAASGPPTHVPA